MFTLIIVTIMFTSIIVSAMYEPTLTKQRNLIASLRAIHTFDDHVRSTIDMQS